MTAHLLAIQPTGDHRPYAAYADGTDPEEGLPNELIDTPTPQETPDETDLLHGYIEDLLSQTDYHEQLAGDIYSGTDISDPDFFDDRDWE